MTTELRTINAGDPASLALLKRAYEELYLPAFTIDSERESLEEWVLALRGEAASPDPCVIIVAADFSAARGRGAIKGLAVADYHLKSGIGVLAYSVIAPACRRQGLGRMLLDARIGALEDMARAHGRALEAVFFEINDPAMIKAGEDSIDPVRRLQIYSKWGAAPVPINYVQPPLAGSGEKCRDLLLMAWPLHGRLPGPETAAKFVAGIYEATLGPGYESDPDYKNMMRQLDEMTGREAA